MEEIDDLVPEVDREFLKAKGFKFSASRAGGDVHIVLHDFALPEAYVPRVADVLIKLPAGYPNANLDMFWTRPDVKLATGTVPKNCDHHEVHGNLSWQRWSRHFNTAWRQGTDDVRSFIASIRHELKKGV